MQRCVQSKYSNICTKLRIILVHFISIIIPDIKFNCVFISPDKNECAQDDTNACPTRSECTNTEPLYRCDCVQGYAMSKSNVCEGTYVSITDMSTRRHCSWDTRIWTSTHARTQRAEDHTRYPGYSVYRQTITVQLLYFAGLNFRE